MAGQKILIVEDNPLNMQLVVDVLEAAGYTALQAKDAEEGIALARAEKPALILMDENLPRMDGLSATKALKQDSATRDILVVILTAHAMKGDKERALASGCDGFLTKPINTREFPKEVAHFLEPKRGA
ncbi:MAG TPA: response regulator [Acidobacteriota bacterium]